MMSKSHGCNFDDCSSLKRELKRNFVGKRVYVLGVPNLTVRKLAHVKKNMLILKNATFSIWILRNFFLGIPKELEESGYMDGASTLMIFYRIILPVSIPGMFTASLFTFFSCWTEFFISLTLNTTQSSRTLSVGIGLFEGQYATAFGTMFAAATVSIVPIVVLVIIFQKKIISGLTNGAVKG